MEPSDILTYFNTAGVVGVLVYQLWRMETGKLISRDVVDEIITAVVKRVLDELGTDRN